MAGKRKTITFTVNDRGCHICTSHAPGTHGYPCLWKDGRNQNMHRVLYEEANGPLGDLVARHICDETLCVNLAHIEPGTYADNTADITERGRHNPPCGERSGTAKLTQHQVAAIRAATGSQRNIAEAYGVNQSSVSRIRRGQRWASA